MNKTGLEAETGTETERYWKGVRARTWWHDHDNCILRESAGHLILSGTPASLVTVRSMCGRCNGMSQRRRSEGTGPVGGSG